jgi:hypothetical protein
MVSSPDSGIAWVALSPLGSGGIVAVGALVDGGSWVESFGVDGGPLAAGTALPAACTGQARAISVDLSDMPAVALEQTATGSGQVCSFDPATLAVSSASVWSSDAGSLEVDDVVVVGGNAQVLYSDGVGIHLLLASDAGAVSLYLPDSDFSPPQEDCKPRQLALAQTESFQFTFLIEVCTLTNFAPVLVTGIRSFYSDGNSVYAAIQSVDNNSTSWDANAIAVDPATFDSTPNALIVGVAQGNVDYGFLAHYANYPNQHDQAVDDTSSEMDGIAFSPAGGVFATLALTPIDRQLEVRTYTSESDLDSDTILAAPGPSATGAGEPTPLLASGSRPGHQLAWGDSSTVYFITTTGLYAWRPQGP